MYALLTFLALLLQIDTLAPGKRALVLIFVRTDCPISNRYLPELERLSQTYSPHGIAFELVYLERDLSDAQLEAHRKAYASTIPSVRDPKLRLAKLAHAHVTPEAAVFIGGKLIYHGRIDNRYVDFGKTRTIASRHDLDEVLAAAAAGKTISHIETKAFGCAIGDLE